MSKKTEKSEKTNENKRSEDEVKRNSKKSRKLCIMFVWGTKG